MVELVDAIDRKAEKPRFKGFVPKGVFHINGASMRFYLPSGVRRAFFRDDKSEQKKVEEVLLWLPAMVFSYQGPKHQLDAYFCKGTFDELMDDKAMLTGAMLPNITTGNVCLGSAMKNVIFSSDIEEMMEIIVERFFGSVFNEWRYAGMRELVGQFIDMAKDPDVTTNAQEVEQMFWENMPKSLKDYTVKESPWARASHLFRW